MNILQPLTKNLGLVRNAHYKVTRCKPGFDCIQTGAEWEKDYQNATNAMPPCKWDVQLVRVKRPKSLKDKTQYGEWMEVKP